MKYRPLLITIIFALFASGCAGLLEDARLVPTDAPSPALESNSAPSATDTLWPTVVPSAADFDYYILALSWAPDYCSANPDDAQECSPGKKYAFVLHGLWPQYTKGYPSDCGDDPLPESVRAQFPRLYPNDKLFGHEWSKHGTCSGLSAQAYLTLAKQIKDHVQIPAAYRAPASPFRTAADDLKDAFLQANPALIDTGLAVNCSGSGRFLSELYICFAKDGQPAACGADVRKSALKSCGNPDFLVRSLR